MHEISKCYLSVVDFQGKKDDKSEEEHDNEDEMNNDAIDANVLDKEVEEFNKNRTEETQQQEEPPDGGKVCHWHRPFKRWNIM